MTPTFTVAELATRVQNALADSFPGEIWVEGELANLSRTGAGHVYFQLVAPRELGSAPGAAVGVALFNATRRAVNAALRRSGGVRMVDGMQIRIRGSVEFYAPQGRVQVRMTAIDPMYTLGVLAAERDRVLRRLRDLDLLDANARSAMPQVPLRIGLVTAAGSAAYADFTTELLASGFGFRVLHVDARVQGTDAPASIVRAVDLLAAQDIDLIALVRGGGGPAELAAFDSEAVALAIAGTRVPVLTGIGHETDRTVADEVAHTAFKTPTACAGGVVDLARHFTRRVDDAWSAIAQRSLHRLRSHWDRTAVLHRQIATGAIASSRSQAGRLETLASAVPQAATRRCVAAERELAVLQSGAARAWPRILERAGERVDMLDSRSRAYDPARALDRGWSLTRRPDGTPVRSAAAIGVDEELVTVLADGSVHSRVTAVEEA